MSGDYESGTSRVIAEELAVIIVSLLTIIVEKLRGNSDNSDNSDN